MNDGYHSAMYVGNVRHRRFYPRAHEFNYKICMVYLDTSEMDKIFSLSPLWSMKKIAPVQFKRSDFHIGNVQHVRTSQHNVNSQRDSSYPSVDEAVRDTVELRIGKRPDGPIRILANLRYWGYSVNPLTTYYCFDKKNNLMAILAEVHNTPWNERHAYVLSNDDFGKKQKVNFPKSLHVSPFNPIDMQYQWESTTPEKTLAIHLENWKDDQKIMDATMTLVREKLTEKSMNLILIRFPLMTVKIIASIYWQALKLWLKGVPTFKHTKSPNT
ncbi:MAG: DUF1365 domain-containing protein [Sphingobacteriales bacterium]|nr:MAG: DUF1365 domain-containing protein [Sphingobacteriales bacterium]